MSARRGHDEIVAPTDAELRSMSPEARFAVGSWLSSQADERQDQRLRWGAERAFRSLDGTELAEAALAQRRLLAARFLDVDALAATASPLSTIDDFAPALRELKYGRRAGTTAAAAAARRAAELRVPGAEGLLLPYGKLEGDDGTIAHGLLRDAAAVAQLPADAVRRIGPPSSLDRRECAKLAAEILYARSDLASAVRRIDRGAAQSANGLLLAARRASALLDRTVRHSLDANWRFTMLDRLLTDLGRPGALPMAREQLPDACRELERDLVDQWEGATEIATLRRRSPEWGSDAYRDDAAAIAGVRRAADLAMAYASEVSSGFASVAADLALRWSRLSGDPEGPALVERSRQLEELAELQGWDDVPERRVRRAINDLLWCSYVRYPLDALDVDRIIRGAEEIAFDAVRRGDPRPASQLVAWGMDLEERFGGGLTGNHITDAVMGAIGATVESLRDELRRFDPGVVDALSQLDPDPFASLEASPEVSPETAEVGWTRPHLDAALERIPDDVNDEIDALFAAWRAAGAAVDERAEGVGAHRVEDRAPSPFVAVAEVTRAHAARLAATDPMVAVALLDVVADEAAEMVSREELRFGSEDRRAFEQLKVAIAEMTLDCLEQVVDAQGARAQAWAVRAADDALRWTLLRDPEEPLEAQVERIARVRRHVSKWVTVLDDVLADNDAQWERVVASITTEKGIDTAIERVLTSSFGAEEARRLLADAAEAMDVERFQEMARERPVQWKGFIAALGEKVQKYPLVQRVHQQFLAGEIPAAPDLADSAAAGALDPLDPSRASLRRVLSDETVDALCEDAEELAAEWSQRCREALAEGADTIFRARVERDVAPEAIDRRIHDGTVQAHIRTLARRLLPKGEEALGTVVLPDLADQPVDPAAVTRLLEHLDWAWVKVRSGSPRETDALRALQAELALVRGTCLEVLGDRRAADAALREAVGIRAPADVSGWRPPSDSLKRRLADAERSGPDPASVWSTMLLRRGSLASEVRLDLDGRAVLPSAPRRAARRAMTASLDDGATASGHEDDRGGSTNRVGAADDQRPSGRPDAADDGGNPRGRPWQGGGKRPRLKPPHSPGL